jgi:hypothetical protein
VNDLGMLKTYLLPFAILLSSPLAAQQTIGVAGVCTEGSIVLTEVGPIDGKPAYDGLGRVLSTDNVQISIYWLPAPDNMWVLAFDGQPYFYSVCPSPKPPATENGPCPWQEVTAGTCTGANPLQIIGDVSLPVSLFDFSAKEDGNTIVLKWKTASESNNRGFEVQRLSDANHWGVLGFVNGAGTTTSTQQYQFKDDKPLAGNNVYRLRQIDLDGKEVFSPTVLVSFNPQTLYGISNNPGNGIYKLNIKRGATGNSLMVIDFSGKIVLRKDLMVAGEYTIDISDRPTGIYLLRIKMGTELYTEKLVKQ